MGGLNWKMKGCTLNGGSELEDGGLYIEWGSELEDGGLYQAPMKFLLFFFFNLTEIYLPWVLIIEFP